jgi:hypothetical protein
VISYSDQWGGKSIPEFEARSFELSEALHAIGSAAGDTVHQSGRADYVVRFTDLPGAESRPPAPNAFVVAAGRDGIHILEKAGEGELVKTKTFIWRDAWFDGICAAFQAFRERLAVWEASDRPMPDGTAECELCGGGVPAIRLTDSRTFADGYPREALDRVQNARFMHMGGFALLHHECGGRQADTGWSNGEPWWDSTKAWWACREPTRPLDADAHFELHCAQCAARWAKSQQ